MSGGLDERVKNALLDLPDDVLSTVVFTTPWQPPFGRNEHSDADGFAIPGRSPSLYKKLSREEIQEECFNKVHSNPLVNTSIRGTTGRIAGLGFETTSYVFEIDEAIKSIFNDPRNRLYYFWPKFIARSSIEGELFLSLTVHDDGFVEVDFIDPANISGGGTDDTGIIFHPRKTLMPLFYNITWKDGENGAEKKEQVPSIFIARYPDLINVAKGCDGYEIEMQANSRAAKGDKKFKHLGEFRRFIVSWDKGFVTRRAVAYMRTVLEWLNLYENLKKYEIDHKKSAGAYAWVFTFEDIKSFKNWMALSDTEKEQSAIFAPSKPGQKMILPPGLKAELKSPQLPQISDSDTDILEMSVAGLNEPADVSTGSAKGTYGNIKASRGPFADRTSDEIAAHDSVFINDFWGSIFFLKSAVSSFPKHFGVKECVGFKNKKPIFKTIKRRPEELIEVTHPVSEMIDFESRSKGLLGSKHGPVSETVGRPSSEISKGLGFGGYGAARRRKATEDDQFPDLVYNLDAEALQEKTEGENGESGQTPGDEKAPKAKSKKTKKQAGSKGDGAE
ncbi:MAG: hypothetical protein RBT11_19600 [Desulfobacterales bacterium]|jgi:hypothetical protein|nr:hypothetical protein [Desulfobacterales bacterium]